MNKLRKTLLLFLTLSLVLLGGCAGDNREQSTETDPGTETASGPPAETDPPTEPSSEEEPLYITFEGTDLEGNTVTQDVFTQSKLTMVNIWATYCNPCLNEMPGLGELAAEHDGSEFQIIGIVSDVWEGEDQTLVESLVQETGADYPHLLVNGSISQVFLASVSGVPTTFFFDGEGAYLGGVVGSAEKSDWEELINGLLEEQ